MPPGRPPKNQEAKVTRWIEELNVAESVLREQQRRWMTTLGAYRGLRVQEGMVQGASYDAVNDVINWMDSIVSRMLPRYYYREPNIVATPEISDPLAEAASIAIKDFLQKEHRYLRTGQHTRKVVLDAILFNRGWMKLGYQAFFETRGDIQKQIGAASPALPREASTRHRAEIIREHKIPEGDIEVDDRINSDSLFTTRLNAFMGSVLVDPLATCEDDAAWIAHRVAFPIERLHRTKRYPPRFLEKISEMFSVSEVRTFMSGNTTKASPRNLKRFFANARELQEEDKNWLVLYEIWDRMSGKLYVVNKSVTDEFGREQDWPYEIKGFPIRSIQFGEDPISFYGQPLAEKWLSLIEELTEYRDLRRERIRKATRKYVIDESAMTDDTLDELQSNEDSTIVKIRAPQQDARRGIVRLDPAGSVTPELSASEALAAQNLSNISGVSEQRRGVSSPYQTATEASIIEAAAADLEGDRVQIVSDFQSGIADALFTLGRQFVSPERMLLTLGLEGENVYKVGEFIRRTNFDISVRVGSSKFVSEEQRLANMERFLMLGLQTGITDVVTITKDMAALLDLPERYVLDPNDEDNEALLARLAVIRQMMGIRPISVGGQGGGLANVAPGGITGAEATNSREGAPNTGNLSTLASGAVTPEG